MNSIKSCAFIVGDGVFLTEMREEVIEVALICVLYSKIVNDQCKLNGFGSVGEETRCVLGGVVATLR